MGRIIFSITRPRTGMAPNLSSLNPCKRHGDALSRQPCKRQRVSLGDHLMCLILFSTHSSGSWDVSWMEIARNDAHSHKAVVIAGRQIGDDEYSGMVHTWYVICSSKFPFRTPTLRRIGECWTSPPNYSL
jgi:hypothetical protein